MPKQFPPGFRRDVVDDARSSGLTQAQVARDFGISENTVQRWVKQANSSRRAHAPCARAGSETVPLLMIMLVTLAVWCARRAASRRVVYFSEVIDVRFWTFPPGSQSGSVRA